MKRLSAISIGIVTVAAWVIFAATMVTLITRYEARKAGYKAEAVQDLGFLRAGTFQYEWFLRSLREELAKGGFKPASIGTSEAELEGLRILGCKTVAQERLGYLRKGTTQYEWCVTSIGEELKKGGLSLFDIDTSEGELNSLWVLGCKTSAQEQLEFLRNGATDQYDWALGFMRKELTRGGLTLADIGTNETEIESLRHKLPEVHVTGISGDRVFGWYSDDGVTTKGWVYNGRGEWSSITLPSPEMEK